MDVSGILGFLPVEHFAVEFAPCQRHADAIADGGLGRVTNRLRSIFRPADRVAAGENREGAECFEPSRRLTQAPVGRVAPARSRPDEATVYADETSADHRESPSQIA